MKKKLHDFPINLRINSGVAAAAREIADEAGISFAALVRECLNALVEQRPVTVGGGSGGGAPVHLHHHVPSALSPDGITAFVRAFKEAQEHGLLPS